VARDESLGLAYLHESAELGDPEAAYNLGVYHEHLAGGLVRRTDWRLIGFGKSGGYDPELAEALRWYERAADQGYEPAEDAVDRLASSGSQERSNS
jgi:TPR repeat protein